MRDVILIGSGKRILEEPGATWRRRLAGARERCRGRLSFMTPEHHEVRYFAVRELPRNHGQPLEPEAIARGVGLPLARVEAILEELERQRFFLVRDDDGAVDWAFTVTVEPTPHRLRFSSGETLWGA